MYDYHMITGIRFTNRLLAFTSTALPQNEMSESILFRIIHKNLEVCSDWNELHTQLSLTSIKIKRIQLCFLIIKLDDNKDSFFSKVNVDSVNFSIYFIYIGIDTYLIFIRKIITFLRILLFL